jgi:Na+-transporting NADH:ubiquinone oxidoreductase subunit C
VKRGPAYTVGFAVVVGVACAALLTAGRAITTERRAANQRAERARSILRVLGIPTTVRTERVGGEVRERPAGNDEILQRFERAVRERPLAGRPAYWTDDAVAVPFTGKGLWGTIDGFVALAPDLETVRRVTFYKHSETPGLGAEIETPAFRNQFRGMPVPERAGRVDLDIQAITGATMTSDRVEAMLERTLAEVVVPAEGGDGG